MKKIWKKWLALALCIGSLHVPVSATETPTGTPMEIGLFYDDTALVAANLENEENSGYSMGYTDGQGQFFSLGYTGETKITMLKTHNIYRKGSTYSTNAGEDSDGVIGCYHLQVGAGYGSFDGALAAAANYPDGFPAFVDGQYSVRVGSYTSKENAEAARNSRELPNAEVVGTSAYGIDVVRTGTDTILFQYDRGAGNPLTLRPGLDEGKKAVTWFKGYRYFGDFRYERRGGKNLTVVNVVNMEDYINCVISQEMSDSWPLEALKAQAVCARTYAERNRDKHGRDGFDLCATVDCQAYPGVGRIGENTAQAAAGTKGLHVWYGEELANTFYYASNGGASENSEHVWNSAIPYLVGKEDPYEAYLADRIPNYTWSKTFTAAQLAELLRSRGYQCGDIVDFQATEVSPTGNVVTVTFTDSAGKNYSFSKEKYTRIMLGTRSINYTIVDGDEYTVDDSGKTLDTLNGVYVMGGDGVAVPLGEELPFYITEEGVQQFAPPVDSYTLHGSGWGHCVGMSQWGAYSMAEQGKTFDEILTFYYTGVTLH